MFWLNKNKNSDTDKRTKPKSNELQAIEGDRGKTSKSQRNSEKLREEALANARAARERIGEETLNRIAAAMTKKQLSAMEQARSKIKNVNSHRVADEILYLLDE
ncbi:MAG TPA: hypothetical protein DEA55_04895 [Rhodospirillaceae bacterium]|nr:hypothetical protein [Rhodospirillaceae bacterium]